MAPSDPYEGRAEEDEAVAGCCTCFGLFRSGWEGNESDHHWFRQNGSNGGESWWMKVKAASEVAGGPKWKTFLRKVGRGCSRDRRGCFMGMKDGFQYDARSYALNFDNSNDSEDAGFLLDRADQNRGTGA